MKRSNTFAAFLVITLVAAAAFATDSVDPAAAAEMPPMGPPEELKELDALIGIWNVAGITRMSPDAEGVEYTGITSYKYIVGGGAVLMDYFGPLMGMDFTGIGIWTYDREKSEWQATWTDNMGARTSMYTGQMTDGRLVVTGEDMMGGATALTRMTTYDITDSTFNWTMENSMDGGENWYVSMAATYTKQQ